MLDILVAVDGGVVLLALADEADEDHGGDLGILWDELP